MKITPQKDGTDGFFAVVLKKIEWYLLHNDDTSWIFNIVIQPMNSTAQK